MITRPREHEEHHVGDILGAHHPAQLGHVRRPAPAHREVGGDAAGTDVRAANAVRVGVFLRDMADFAAMNEIYREFFSEPLPARTTIQSDLPGFEIEVDAILIRG